MLLMQTRGPCRPRHRPTIVRSRLLLKEQTAYDGGHRMCDKCASYFRPSSLLCPSSSTRLRSDEQIATGIFSLLNDYRLYKGMKPFGFANPWIYGPGAGSFGFTDITSGNNPGCGTQGFYASNGWDPVRPARPSSLRSDFADSEHRRSPA